MRSCVLCEVEMMISFKNINWGEDEAKDDDNLDEYFVEFPGFEKTLSGEKRYIIGRKGTGKTAILQQIRNKSQDDPMLFHTDISLRDFPLNDFKSMGDKSKQDKSKYVSAWKFLFLTELSNMLLEDNSIPESDEISFLREFIKSNFPGGTSFMDVVSQLKSNKNKVSFQLASLSGNLLTGEHEHGNGTERSGKIHFNKAARTLENVIKRISTDSQFVFLVDELDEGYEASNSNLSLVLLALLRATDELFKSFRTWGPKCIPIVALRSDIFDRLADNDLNKLDDYVLRLNWTTDISSPWSLKKIVEKRIEATIRSMKNSEAIINEINIHLQNGDLWGLIANNDTPIGVNMSLWQYICVSTFSRPRDIIKFLKCCRDVVSGRFLTYDDVTKAELDYSAWFYREFRDEVQSFLPCWESVLNCIAEGAVGKGKIDDLLLLFGKRQDIKKWCQDSNKEKRYILELLFDYSVIGCVDKNGRWIFKYKDNQFGFMPSYPFYAVHYGFCRKLRIKRNYSNTLLNAYINYKLL